MLFSLISRNVAGQTKKSTVLAMTFIAWAAGNATAPQVRLAASLTSLPFVFFFFFHLPYYIKSRRYILIVCGQIFQSSDAPRYKNGFIAHFCLYVLFNVLLVALRVIYALRNKRRDGSATRSERSHVNAFLDMTDQENEDFFYVS